MAYIVYGPGIRDEIPLDNVFQNRNVAGISAITPIKNDPGQSQQQRQQAVQQYQNNEQLSESDSASGREAAITAEQIMSSPVIFVREQDSIVSVWENFRARRFRYMPVLNDKDELLGIISDRDLLRYAAINGRVPPFDADSAEASISIATVYRPQVLTAGKDDEIRYIARIMFERGIGAMPIVNDAGALLGIVTRSDILRAVVDNVSLELWV